ncbi:DUF6464 family protein [Nostoc sp.]|uniref:DUF6464 family protein n=1 Tax=Nostoc sp. TaxID=1180 RepID=UPI003FA5D461
MNQIERVEGNNYALRLWSDATYEVSTIAIKSLLNIATQRLEIQLEIDARYRYFERRWRVRFSWHSEFSGRQNFEQILDHSQVVCANPVFLERLAFDLGDRIRRSTAPDGSQNWVIVRYREEHFAKIHQAGKRSINLILYEVTQEGDLTTNHTTVTIRARIPSDAIRRGDSVEIGGMLLQGELLGWVEETGQQGWFLFSPNTQQVNTSPCSLDETRITFTTRPRTNRLASFERMSQMLERGQIELPPRGHFDQFLTVFEGIDPDGNAAREVFVATTRPNAINAIGDVSCEYNAKSQYLRCTVNPCGPCEGCQHYEKI